MQVAEFIDEFREGIMREVVATYPPVYDDRARLDPRFDPRRLRRQPLGGQREAIKATALSLTRNRSTNLVGEMGTGKTYIAASAAYLAGLRRIIVLCPSHLVRFPCLYPGERCILWWRDISTR